MPIISVVGRKQKKVRAFIALLYVLLTLGAITMVYPFVLMISTSFTSPVDQNEFVPIPRYFYKEDSLYRKYIEAKYNEDVSDYNIWVGTDWAAFEKVSPPARANRRFVEDWRKFQNALPPDHKMLMFSESVSLITPESVDLYRRYLSRKFGNDLKKLNQVYREVNENWMEVYLPAEDWAQRSFTPVENIKYREYLAFKKSLPDRYLSAISGDGLYQDFLRLSYGGIDRVNVALGTHYKSRGSITLSPRVPPGGEAHPWEAFVRNECPVHFIKLDPKARPAFQAFIKAKYQTIDAYNKSRNAAEKSFATLAMPATRPKGGIALVDWVDFIETAAPVNRIEVRTPEVLYRESLTKRFGSVDGVNRAFQTAFASTAEIRPPLVESDLLDLQENTRAIRKEFIARNYREVTNYIALHGRATLNTVILCFAAVLTALTVNPLCAYALSRYNLKATYKILLFLLATMAFPAEVSAIPSFLLIKNLHLLGTYWAIILPGLANGYSIFLLKGFFDSLPKELYEAATLDGASEMRMFWTITMNLSKPVLAVIGLAAFTHAYGSFMWAFLVLQDPKMWTLMVWLYQMQQWAPQFLVYAGLVLAAIPTLLVFIFAQNIIMRGIIIPSEK